ncbi:MAG TPA: SGNH/GDSL hydrolase family protein [Candidatus Tectomicrobia bacterium]|nr:SGNH/GDSL hydrolase family protein [Candidatus Tectomicrobia bacterium]
MVRRLLVAAAVAAAVALLAACAADRARTLPHDRSAPIVYVALGDSTVEGIGASRPETNYVSRIHARLRHLYPQASLVNLGDSGATSGQVVNRQLERAVLLRPDLVTLSVGPNDITGRVPVDTFEKNLDTIFARLVAETRAVVVANLLPDLAVTPRFRRPPMQEAVGRQTVVFNEALARAAKRHGVELVDLYGPSRDEVPRRPDLISLDGYHPSDVGYARWAELLWAGVERRIVAR